jgi:hypothetical protein
VRPSPACGRTTRHNQPFVAFPPTTHVTVTDAQDLGRLTPGNLPGQRPQYYFLYFHCPLHRDAGGSNRGRVGAAGNPQSVATSCSRNEMILHNGIWDNTELVACVESHLVASLEWHLAGVSSYTSLAFLAPAVGPLLSLRLQPQFEGLYLKRREIELQGIPSNGNACALAFDYVRLECGSDW